MIREQLLQMRFGAGLAGGGGWKEEEAEAPDGRESNRLGGGKRGGGVQAEQDVEQAAPAEGGGSAQAWQGVDGQVVGMGGGAIGGSGRVKVEDTTTQVWQSHLRASVIRAISPSHGHWDTYVGQYFFFLLVTCHPSALMSHDCWHVVVGHDGATMPHWTHLTEAIPSDANELRRGRMRNARECCCIMHIMIRESLTYYT